MALDAKRLRVFHSLHRAGSHDLIATGEQMHLHVGVATGRTEAVPQQVHAMLERIRAAQAADPSPSQLGRAVGQPPNRD